MSDSDPAMSEQPVDDNQAAPSTEAGALSGAQAPIPGWRKLRMIALGGLIVCGSGLLFSGLLTGSAAYYTSRSEFCSSCHIMDPYYESWERSSHADVSCVKCHFPPGAAEKVRGKMLGLVQLATYLTESEGPRPVAEIPDISCLRSGCHDTRSLAGPVKFHEIAFDHGPHMVNLDLGEEQMQLRCTSCHGQFDQSEHMSVSTTTCFVCHFKDGHFNEGVGACTRCHQIPEDEFDLGGGITFTHELAFEKGVDCQNCHGTLNRGDGNVTREQCQACHDRKADLEWITDAQHMHQIHVTDHKVDCLGCHQEIHHALEMGKVAHPASDCSSCHPDHHREQVNMLMGVGGKSIPDRPATMLTTRVECRACHRVKQVSATGTVLWKASADVCSTCHSSAAVVKLQSYQEDVLAVLTELESALQRVRDAIVAADLAPARMAALQTELERVQHDVTFLGVGNGIHNIHYASTLTRVLLEDIARLCRELDIPEPQVSLPDDMEHFE